MTKKISTERNLLDDMLYDRKKKQSFLDNIDKIIDWKPIENFLNNKITRVASADGRPAYPPLAMFKLLLLQRWYNLSDVALEDALYDRISFMKFSNFSVQSSIPDESTICRFRNDLLKNKRYGRLLKRINSQLQKKGLLVKKGAIVDASVIESSRHPSKTIEVVPSDRREDKTDNLTQTRVIYSEDKDATWLKKGHKFHYGYKVHMATDSKNGFILGGHVTPANIADTVEFKKLVKNIDLAPNSKISADKGYCSQSNRDFLKENNYLDGIMMKAKRNKPLKEFEKLINKQISKYRFIVERGFGTLKQHYKFNATRYLGIEKTNQQFHLNAMAFNIKKAVLMAF
jgi:IS5 family transposase